jgi:hypothetical protein
VHLILNATLAAVALLSLLQAQRVRDEWRHFTKNSNLILRAEHTLADLPMTPAERSSISAAIDKELAQGYALSARAFRMDHQILVSAPHDFCGATGNCAFWIFQRNTGKPTLVLESDAQGVFMGRNLHLGRSDIVTSLHDSAFRQQINVYRWNGKVYDLLDCYRLQYDPGHPSSPPAIEDCTPAPH